MSDYSVPNEQLARAIVNGDDSVYSFLDSLLPKLEPDQTAILLDWMAHLTLEGIELGLNIANATNNDSKDNNSAIVYLEGLIAGVNIGISAK